MPCGINGLEIDPGFTPETLPYRRTLLRIESGAENGHANCSHSTTI